MFFKDIVLIKEILQVPDSKKDIKMIHTFSPNWYRPQCLLFSESHLFYASNYVLYKYNLGTRKIEADRCFRKIAMRTGMNSKDIKIHTIQKLGNKLIIGTNQKQAIVLSNTDTLEVEAVLKVVADNQPKKNKQLQHMENKDKEQKEEEGGNGVAYCAVCGVKGKEYVVFISEMGAMTKLQYNSAESWSIAPIPTPTLPQPHPQHPKQIIPLPFGNFHLLLTTKGNLTMYNPNFTQILRQISSSSLKLDNEHVLSVDTWYEGGVLWVSMFTRTKNMNNYLHLWNLVCMVDADNKQEFQVKSMASLQVRVHYPKIMMDKVKSVQKAAISIKMLSNRHVLMSGKLGQLFIIDLLAAPQVLTIKPQSIQTVPECLSIIEDPKHYKQIYQMYTHTRPATHLSPSKTQLFTISIDQTMCIWQILATSPPALKFVYCLKFITSEIVSIFHSEADTRTVYILLRDSNIRSMNPLGQVGYFLNQYWKFTKKWKIVKAVAHPCETGVVAMVTDCGKVLLYDLDDERMIKVYDLEINNKEQEIINISFEWCSILQALEQLSQQIQPVSPPKWVQTCLKQTRHHNKPIQNSQKIGLLIQQKHQLTFIHDPPTTPTTSTATTTATNTAISMEQQANTLTLQNKSIEKSAEKVYQMKRVCRIQRVHNTRLWDQKSMLLSQGKAGKLIVWVWFQGKVGKVEVGLKIGGRAIFRVQQHQSQLAVTAVQYKSKKVWLHTFTLPQQTPPSSTCIDLCQVCEQAVLDPSFPQAIFFNPKQDQLTYINFKNTGKIEVRVLETGNKIENASFYCKEYIIAGFKDQSIKCLKLADMEEIGKNREAPNKRVKRQKKEQKEEQEEQGEEAGGEMVEEKREKQQVNNINIMKMEEEIGQGSSRGIRGRMSMQE